MTITGHIENKKDMAGRGYWATYLTIVGVDGRTQGKRDVKMTNLTKNYDG